jgi:Na+/H+ antiporter NhaC
LISNTMEPHPYGWLSVIPSLIAIGLAIATRRVVLSMFIGLFCGALITVHGNVFRALGDTMELHLWQALIQESRLRVFLFTATMGAMVGVIERAGGMAGLVQVVSRYAHNRQRGQLVTWLLGMLVFFDDYANSVLLGSTLRPLCTRLRISREKLAYLVDSTAAPVAGLAVISTWVAGEIDFVQNGLEGLPSSDGTPTAFRLFIASIPYRFYPIWSLAFVALVGWMQRDFGPMLKAEQRCLSGDDTSPELPGPHGDVRPSGWWNAVIPVVVTIASVVAFLYRTGVQSLGDVAVPADASLWQIFGHADSYFALLWGSVLGLFSAVVLVGLQRLLSWQQTQQAISQGALAMFPALVILLLASALSTMTGHDALPAGPSAGGSTAYPAQAYRLYTGEFIASLLAQDSGAPGRAGLAAWMPTLVFVLAAVISFSTGTSWGTMAILMPIAIPLAHGAITPSTPDAWQTDPVLLGTIGSVLSGSIFGDHCSPISDTTVLSSQASGCEHTAHVWTQLPYALVVGLVSIVFGTLPLGFGWSVHLLLPAGLVVLAGVLWLVGTRTAQV